MAATAWQAAWSLASPVQTAKKQKCGLVGISRFNRFILTVFSNILIYRYFYST